MAWLSDGESPGRRSSPLDEIGPAAVELFDRTPQPHQHPSHTVEVTPRAAQLLELVLE